jgi:hypothetical protein
MTCDRAVVFFHQLNWLHGVTEILLKEALNTKANTHNVNKTWTLLQTTRGKDEPNILNKTWALLQTTRGKDEPNILNKTSPPTNNCYTSLVLHSLMYIWYYIERLTNRYLDEISKSSHIKLVSTSPINKANIKIKIKACGKCSVHHNTELRT